MPALRRSARNLFNSATAGTLSGEIETQLRMSGHGVGASERRSWERSLTVLAQDLVDAGLDDVEVLVEYQLPLTSRRVDAVLAGVHPRTGDDSYVVVELKQWSRAVSYEDSETLVLVEGMRRAQLHPGIQVAGYCEYLSDFLGVLARRHSPVAGVAYLHNASDREVTDLFALPPPSTAASSPSSGGASFSTTCAATSRRCPEPPPPTACSPALYGPAATCSPMPPVS